MKPSEAQTLAEVINYQDLPYSTIPEPDDALDIAERILASDWLAAREATWRAPIEALAAEPPDLPFSYASDPRVNFTKGWESCQRAIRRRLTAALGSVSAPGNEAGQ